MLLELSRLASVRLWQHRSLVLWTLVGLVAASALAISLLMYVDAVNLGLLSKSLPEPGFNFRYRYLGVWNGNVSTGDHMATGRYLREDFAAVLGLPVAQLTEYTGAGIWNATQDTLPLGSLTLAAFTGAETMMQITAGDWPPDPAAVAPDTVPVLVPQRMFETMGVQVGDVLDLTRAGGLRARVQVAALWQPVDAGDPRWLFPPRFFDTVLLVPPDALTGIVASQEKPIEEAAWGVLFDGDAVKPSEVPGLLARIREAERSAGEVRPGIRLEVSPVAGLEAFNAEVAALIARLSLISLPIAGMVLYFIVLVAGLLVGRQAAEDSVLASRGLNRRAILTIHALMWLGLAAAAWTIAVLLSPGIVQIIGQTRAFLRFDPALGWLSPTYSTTALLAGVTVALFAAAFGMAAAWNNSRHGIIRQAESRTGAAWWQRTYLDVLLMLPAGYAAFSLWTAGGRTASAEQAFSEPLTLAGPTLFALSLTLLFIRLYPLLLQALAGLLKYGRGLMLLMALRELTRSRGRYRGAMLLMGFTLSLTGFTASLASTLDRSLEDSIDYEIGADAVIVPAADAETESETDSGGQQTGVTVTGFNVLPADDLATIPGVRIVSRVGRYDAQIVLPNQRPTGTLLGIDRERIAAAARTRADFSTPHLADLFNRLAVERTGLLLDRRNAEALNIREGQRLTLQISALDALWEISVPVIGLVDYFPTLDPGAGFFGLMSMDVIFETVGSALPHDLWLGLHADADPQAVRSAALGLGYPILEWRDPQSRLLEALAQPLRRGVLGFLSVGFIAAVGLTLIATVIQSAAAFRAQSTQLAILRAMGWKTRASAGYLLLVQGLTAVGGVLGGTVIGLLTSFVFLPVLNFGGGLPPYLVRVAWNEIALVYGVFGATLWAVILGSSVLLSRQSLAVMVKLGD